MAKRERGKLRAFCLATKVRLETNLKRGLVMYFRKILFEGICPTESTITMPLVPLGEDGLHWVVCHADGGT